MKQDNTSTVTVSFSGPQKKGGHHVYSIVGSDKNGEFNTVRRYSDFDTLRSVLANKWPGLYVPSLPEKKFIGNEDSTFIQIRKQGLLHFIMTLKQLQHFWYSQETQLFLRKIGDPQKDLQKMKETSLTSILEKYKLQFPESFNKQVSKDLNNQIIDFGQYLKKAKGLLQNLQKMIEQIFSSRKKFNEKYLNLLQVTIPDYQKNCMEVYMNENTFQELEFTGSKKEKLLPLFQEFRKKNNSALYVLQEIRREKAQILAFQDILKTKENYTTQKQKAISKVKDLEIQTTKILSGKQSLISKIKKKSKDQQLKDNQASIQKAQDEQKNFALICQVIIVLLGHSQIQRFKEFRQKSYYSLLKKMFELQKQQCKLRKQFWGLVLKENHQKQELDNFFEGDNSPVKKSEKAPQPTEIGTSQKQSEPQVEDMHHGQLHGQNEDQPQQVQIQQVEQVNEEQVKVEQVEVEQAPVEQVKSDQNEENDQNQVLQE